MNESSNTSYHTEIRGKAWPIGMSLWGGGSYSRSVTSWSQKMQKIRRRLETNLNLVPR